MRKEEPPVRIEAPGGSFIVKTGPPSKEALAFFRRPGSAE
jgi:hypothetical protein